jgi:1-acyl-sn-glycerol-3-phosphate acyltransferase
MPAETEVRAGRDRKAREVPAISAVTLRIFRRVVRSYFRRHFRAVMVRHEERLARFDAGFNEPLVVYANHSSLWDPMVSVLLAQELLPGRRHYAPMDAAALKKYPILRRIGIFPVEMASARGAAQFLRTSQAILASGGVVWITPQGRFVDSRETLLGFKPGLGALAARVPGLQLVPLAIEYTFWDERLPETLLCLGETVTIDVGVGADVATRELEAALGLVMAELKQAAMGRDAKRFGVLLTGQRGTGGIYAMGRRLRAWVTGKTMVVDHTQRDDS